MIPSDCGDAIRVDNTRYFGVSKDIFDSLYDGEKLSDVIRLVALVIVPIVKLVKALSPRVTEIVDVTDIAESILPL